MPSAVGDSTDIDALWDYDYPKTTERRFRNLLATQPPHTPLAIELMTQIARTLGFQRKYDEAHALLDEAQRLLTADMTRPTIRYLLERGRIYYYARDQLDRACSLFMQSLQLAIAHGADNYAIDVAHMLGVAAPLDQQLDWNLKALELTEQTADQLAKRWDTTLYLNIGVTYYNQGRYDAALEYLRKSQSELDKLEGAKRRSRVRLIQWYTTRALKALQPDEAAPRSTVEAALQVA